MIGQQQPRQRPPSPPDPDQGAWGVGVELPGDAADLVENTVITKNANNGVLGLEYSQPVPRRKHRTQDLEEKGACTRTIYFQLDGNKIANNTFEETGPSGAEFASDIVFWRRHLPVPPVHLEQQLRDGNS